MVALRPLALRLVDPAWADRVVVPGMDAFAPEALAHLERLRTRGPYPAVDEPALALYRLEADGHAQLGIVGDLDVADARHGRLRVHELTEVAREEALVSHRAHVGADACPISVAYPARPVLSALLADLTREAPAVSVATADGVRHEAWAITDPDAVTALLASVAELEAVYLLDGHHRLAAATRHAERVGGGDGRPDDPGRILAALFPDDEVRAFDYRRVVRWPPGADADALLAEVRRRFAVTPAADAAHARPRGRGEMALRLGGAWYRLVPHPRVVGDALPGRLDEVVVQRHLLDAVLGVTDPRTDPALSFVPGTVSLEELSRHTRPDDVQVVLHPPPLTDLQAVADVGAALPPKSTYFTPKLASGLMLQRRRPSRAVRDGEPVYTQSRGIQRSQSLVNTRVSPS